MTAFWAEIKYKVDKCPETFTKNCTVNDEPYQEDCLQIKHSNTIFYVRKQVFGNQKVKIVNWNIKDNFNY